MSNFWSDHVHLSRRHTTGTGPGYKLCKITSKPENSNAVCELINPVRPISNDALAAFHTTDKNDCRQATVFRAVQPMIFHIPHASFRIPSDLRSAFLLDNQELEDELRVMTDAYTDDLFGSHAGTDDSVVTFPVSRLVVDPERFLDDLMEAMSEIGMGVIYERTSCGKPLRNIPSLEERDALIQRFYIRHHKLLNAAIESEFSKHGSALILDCHSFPSKPFSFESDQNPNRPDICIGTDEFHTPKQLVKITRQAIIDEGLTCEVNRPFSGSIVPRRYYREIRMVASIMIELNRSLYMDEDTGDRSIKYSMCRASVGRIVERIRSQMTH